MTGCCSTFGQMALLSSQRLLLDPVYCSIVALLAAHYSAVEEGQGTLSRHRLIWNQGGGWNTQHIFVECVFSSCISYFSHQLCIRTLFTLQYQPASCTNSCRSLTPSAQPLLTGAHMEHTDGTPNTWYQQGRFDGACPFLSTADTSICI